MKKYRTVIGIFVFFFLFSGASFGQACCSKTDSKVEDKKTSIANLDFNDYALVDHNGNDQTLATLIKGKVVIMNFIFTSCRTICPPMGANFAALKKQIGDTDDNHIMLSVSLDPATDTPARLTKWKKQFGSQIDDTWTLLTGEKKTVDNLLKDLGVFTPLIDEHAPIIIMGTEGKDDWIRTNGLADTEILTQKANEYLAQKKAEEQLRADINYFTDLEVENQHGEKLNFFTDLMKDKVVFINPFFAECPGSCPIMHNMMKEVQAHLGDKLGTDVNLLSITNLDYFFGRH